jgi:hypothetical protein
MAPEMSEAHTVNFLSPTSTNTLLLNISLITTNKLLYLPESF